MIALHRLAHVCVVSSLHDGMNLVAKEFAASRVDEDGVLVLSKFAGAARELKDALQINPFSIEEGAEACYAALRMQPEERKRRMRRMRENLKQNNIYRWAGRFLSEWTKTEFPVNAGEEEDAGQSSRGATLRPAELGVAV
jgi:trehalose 6-phosphate synthase